MNTVIQIVTVIILIIGVLMSLFPVLPGIPIIFAVFLVYGLIEGFHHITPLFLAVMFMVTVLSYVIDNVAGWWGAKKFGASRVGVYGAILGGTLGVFINPVLGIIIGPFIGAVVAELIFSRRALQDALKVGIGTLVGFAGGSIVRSIVALFMVIVFLNRIF
ncbi:MAG TPA: DUF456 domain-containing protein [Syntrophomonadaceae bacterium]|nr:DUF456 domain-containing protein [Syntrophomonadaceae bacterium]